MFRYDRHFFVACTLFLVVYTYSFFLLRVFFKCSIVHVSFCYSKNCFLFRSFLNLFYFSRPFLFFFCRREKMWDFFVFLLTSLLLLPSSPTKKKNRAEKHKGGESYVGKPWLLRKKKSRSRNIRPTSFCSRLFCRTELLLAFTLFLFSFVFIVVACCGKETDMPKEKIRKKGDDENESAQAKN